MVKFTRSAWLPFVVAVALSASLVAWTGADAQPVSQPIATPIPVTEFAVPSTAVAPQPDAVVAAPVQNSDGSWNFTPLVDGFVKFAGGCLAIAGTWLLAQASWPLKDWLGIHVETKQVAKDIEMDKYAKLAVQEAIRYVLQQTGTSYEDLKQVDIRNPFLSMAAGYLFKVDPGVWRWVSNKEESDVMKWIEAYLPAEAALPKAIVDGVGPVPAKVAEAAGAQP